MSVYTDCDVNIQGYSSNVIAGDQIIHTYEKKPVLSGFERLEKEVAANALHNSGEVSDQPKCHPGTRVAILDHLIAWAAALTYTYPIIWLHGPAGAGKSAIQRTVAQILSEKGLLFASFFFFRTAIGRNSTQNFIATLSYQLVISIPATRPYIEQAIERNPLIFSLSLWDQAKALIISPLLAVVDNPSFDAGQCPRIAIIDGLDECRDPKKQCEILDILPRILQKLPIPFAVVIASRPEHHIRNAFDLGDLNERSSRLSLDDSYNSDADIKKYLVDRFRKIREQHPLRAYLPTPWPKKGVIDKLVAKASGQFIYASTVDGFVSSMRHKPSERLDILLGHLDAGKLKPFAQLDALYSVIFQAIDRVDRAGTLRVLGAAMVLSVFQGETLPPRWGFYSPMESDPLPYSPRIIEGLLGLGNGDVRYLLLDLESLLTIDNDDANIRFFHASLSDYLFDKSRSAEFWIDAGAVYADLVQQCLFWSRSEQEWRGFRMFFLRGGAFLFSKATPTQGLHDAIKTFDMPIGVNTLSLQPVVVHGVRQLKFSDAEELYHDQLVLFARAIQKFSDAKNLYRDQLVLFAQAIRADLQVYFEHTPARFAFITAIISKRTGTGCEPLKRIFRLSHAMVENDNNVGFKLFLKPLDANLVQALNDLLDDSKGQYFVDDSEYADIALNMINYISAKIRRPFQVPPIVANALPKILSKSATRRDLTKCIKTFFEISLLWPGNSDESLIMDAMTEYISGSRSRLESPESRLREGHRIFSKDVALRDHQYFDLHHIDTRQSTPHLRYDLVTERASIRERSKTTNVCPPAKRKASLSLPPSPSRPFPSPRLHRTYPSSLSPAPSSSSMLLSPPSISLPSMSAVKLELTTNYPASLFSGSINDPIEISDDEERLWPEDFFVDEVVSGLQEYEKTTEGQRKAVFEQRYPGIMYCRTTVFDQVKKWQEAPAQLKDACLGPERIRWSVFVRRLKKGKMVASASVIDLSYLE